MEDPRQLILADQNLRDIKPVMDADVDFAITKSRFGMIGGMRGMHMAMYSTSKIQSSAESSEETR